MQINGNNHHHHHHHHHHLDEAARERHAEHVFNMSLYLLAARAESCARLLDSGSFDAVSPHHAAPAAVRAWWTTAAFLTARPADPASRAGGRLYAPFVRDERAERAQPAYCFAGGRDDDDALLAEFGLARCSRASSRCAGLTLALAR
jgi:hypothetical protein